jgi:hypothetical protein
MRTFDPYSVTWSDMPMCREVFEKLVTIFLFKILCQKQSSRLNIPPASRRCLCSLFLPGFPTVPKYLNHIFPTHTMQTSQGKTRNFPCEGGGFIKHIPFADGRLRGHVPACPNHAAGLIGFPIRRPASLDWASSRIASHRSPCPSFILRLCDY